MPDTERDAATLREEFDEQGPLEVEEARAGEGPALPDRLPAGLVEFDQLGQDAVGGIEGGRPLSGDLTVLAQTFTQVGPRAATEMSDEFRLRGTDRIQVEVLRLAVADLDGFTAAEMSELTSHWPPVEVRDRESKYLDLAAIRSSQTELITHFGRSTRANLRKRLREYGELQTEWATSLAAANDIFVELL